MTWVKLPVAALVAGLSMVACGLAGDGGANVWSIPGGMGGESVSVMLVLRSPGDQLLPH
jgi:hypothetical protein